MTGRAEVDRQRQQLDTTFSRASGLDADAELIGALDPEWRNDLETFIVDEYKDALDGIVDLRNSVAHGRYVGVTLSRVSDYYARVKTIIDRIAALVVPL